MLLKFEFGQIRHSNLVFVIRNFEIRMNSNEFVRAYTRKDLTAHKCAAAHPLRNSGLVTSNQRQLFAKVAIFHKRVNLNEGIFTFYILQFLEGTLSFILLFFISEDVTILKLLIFNSTFLFSRTWQPWRESQQQ